MSCYGTWVGAGRTAGNRARAGLAEVLSPGRALGAGSPVRSRCRKDGAAPAGASDS